MCGRFSLDQYPDSIIEALLDMGDSSFFTPRTQIYPSNEVAVAMRTDNGTEIAPMTWGWQRSFSKRPLINTRSAEAWGKKTWSKALLERRCIIPASGFFEWDENQPKGKRDRYRIHPAQDDGFALGGLYEINSDGEMFMSILTTTPNKKMAKIHHRMPVIIDKKEFDPWFESVDREYTDNMMQPVNENRIELVKEV